MSHKKIKILIIRLSALGDIVHSFPALQYLNSRLEEFLGDNFEIDFLINRGFKDLLFDQVYINRIYSLPNKKLSTLIRVGPEIKSENYDYVIDFQGLIKSSLFSLLSQAQTIGFAKPREAPAAWFYTHKLENYSIMEPGKHVIEHNFKLANFALEKILSENLPSDKTMPKLDYIHKKPLRPYKLKQTKKIVLIPCTTWESKFWQKENWVDLTERLAMRFDQAKIYMTGTLKEKDYLEAIRYELAASTHSRTELVLDKSLIGLKQFFTDADLVIGVDTGPLHLAVDTLFNSESSHIIGIYGPSSASRSGPYSFSALSYDEMFHTKASHKRTNKADQSSMAKITVQNVFDKILELSS